MKEGALEYEAVYSDGHVETWTGRNVLLFLETHGVASFLIQKGEVDNFLMQEEAVAG